MSQHLAVRSRPRWGRFLGIPIAFWVAFGAVVAVAAFVFVLRFSGSVDVGSGTVRYITTQAPVTVEGTCSGTFPSDTELALTWSNPLPSEVCVLDFAVGSNGNTTAMRLQNFQAPAGITASLPNDCGVTIAANDPLNKGLRVRLTVDESAAGSIVFAQTDGLQWVPSTTYNPALCS